MGYSVLPKLKAWWACGFTAGAPPLEPDLCSIVTLPAAPLEICPQTLELFADEQTSAVSMPAEEAVYPLMQLPPDVQMEVLRHILRANAARLVCRAFRAAVDAGRTNVRLRWPAAATGGPPAEVELRAMLARLPSVQIINARYCPADFLGIVALPGLTDLYLCCSPVADLTPLSRCGRLKYLSLISCRCVTDLAPLSSCTALTKLQLSDCHLALDLAPVQACPALTELLVDGRNIFAPTLASGPANVPIPVAANALQNLSLRGRHTLTNIAFMAGYTALTHIDLFDSSALVDLSPLSHLFALVDLNLGECTRVVDVCPLACCTELTVLRLHGCTGIVDISPLAACVSLTTLGLLKCSNVRRIGRVAINMCTDLPADLLEVLWLAQQG